jgi:hypothetical protein
MVGGWYLEKVNYQEDLFTYLFITVEETLEMIGLIMLVYALLSLLQTKYGGFSIYLSGATASPNQPEADTE